MQYRRIEDTQPNVIIQSAGNFHLRSYKYAISILKEKRVAKNILNDNDNRK